MGQPHAFGENWCVCCHPFLCAAHLYVHIHIISLESWLSLFQYNVSLRKIIWRLDSRKSFPINKFLVRNNSLKKFVDEGRDTTDLKVPDNCNCDIQSLRGGAPAE